MAKWITSRGDTTLITKMDTSHLFYTLRLVWNSMMPRPLSVGTYKACWFNPDLYTADYWRKTLPAIYKELNNRTDLSDRYKEQLATMQLPHLLAIVTLDDTLKQAIGEYCEREDHERTWDDEPGNNDW